MLSTGAHAIFISYHRSDAEVARRIRNDLMRRGASTWMDEFDIPPGAYWPDEIDKALESCDTVIGLLSPEAIGSRNVKNEWDWALQNERRLLLVLVHPCVVPHRYISINWIDATESGIDAVVDQLASTVGFSDVLLADNDAFVLPVTRYTRSGDGNVAWQVFGDGPIDLVLVPGFISHLELQWESARKNRWLQRLGTLARVVAFDKRGTGLSDRVGRVLTLDERVDDIRAVMDAANLERAVIFGVSEGGSLAALFAALNPERTVGLMIYGGLASYVVRSDYPWPPTCDEYHRRTDEMEATLHERWGTDAFAREIVEFMAPSGANDRELISYIAKLMRLGASPGAEVARRRMNIELDARGILPTIAVPSLVLHRTGDADVNVGEGRYIAEHIPGSRFVELPGDDHFYDLGDQDIMFDAIESFLSELSAQGDEAGSDRKLATAICLDLPLGAPQIPSSVTEIIRAAIETNGGTVVFQGPRRLLALFQGSIRAMSCAQETREALNANNLVGRIGLHSGVVDTGGLTSGATDVAAELASMGASGAIVVSESVVNISPGSGFTFEPLGQHELAASPQPLDLFLLVERSTGEISSARS